MRKIKPSFIEANLGHEVVEVEIVPGDDSPFMEVLISSTMPLGDHEG
jgi:hypothetical protein